MPCFTAVRSPESEGIGEASIKTVKCNYSRVHPCPDALTVPRQLPAWIEAYNQFTYTAACTCAHLVNSSRLGLTQPRGWFNRGQLYDSKPIHHEWNERPLQRKRSGATRCVA